MTCIYGNTKGVENAAPEQTQAAQDKQFLSFHD